jgi:hypothetical protein
LFRACVDAIRDEQGRRLGCLCAAEVKAEMEATKEGTAA